MSSQYVNIMFKRQQYFFLMPFFSARPFQTKSLIKTLHKQFETDFEKLSLKFKILDHEFGCLKRFEKKESLETKIVSES